jgi:hypothetical protein
MTVPYRVIPFAYLVIFPPHPPPPHTSAGKWADAFLRWFATLMAARAEEHWFTDTEEDEAVEDICRKFCVQWSKLRAQTDKVGGCEIPQCFLRCVAGPLSW